MSKRKEKQNYIANCGDPDPERYASFWFHPDHLGSSNYITDMSGNISQHPCPERSRRVEYLPFGETLVEEHKNSNNSPYKFNGKELDDETGNYYYGARYYNPKFSIWLSVDPLAEKYPGWSPYNYTLLNPVKLVDPDGRKVDVMPPDRYKIDREGNISYYDNKGGCNIDYLMDENGNEISITDTNILPQLTNKKDDWDLLDRFGKKHNGFYATANDYKETKEIFEFVSQASDVEWALRKHTDKTFLGTNHVTDAVAGLYYSPKTLLKDIHNHDNGTNASTGSSLKNFSDYNAFLRRNKDTDLGNAQSIYGDLIKMGQISTQNGYKGAPKFYIFKTSQKTTEYVQYDPWNTRL